MRIRDSAHFSRSFKAYFGVDTAGLSREFCLGKQSRQSTANSIKRSATRENLFAAPAYNRDDTKSDSRRNTWKEKWRSGNSGNDVAYVRYIGRTRGTRSSSKTCTENSTPGRSARAHRSGGEEHLVYHDNPEITAEDKLRVSLPHGTEGHEGGGRGRAMSIPAESTPSPASISRA
jgi:hypothetical protein